MRNELIHLQLPAHVVIHQAWQLSSALNTTECAALPHATRDQLESLFMLAVERQQENWGGLWRTTHVSSRSPVQPQPHQ